MNNSQIAQLFQNIADLLEMKGESVFTVRAYQRAARTIQRLPDQIQQMLSNGKDLRQIPTIGQAISDKISEFVNTGTLHYYERLRAEFPEGILDVMRIPGMGPKTTARAWKEMGITTVAQLEAAIIDGRISTLPRMGKKSAENLLRHIQFTHTSNRRVPIGKALPVASYVIESLQNQCPDIIKLIASGGLRRFEETIDNIDLACSSYYPQPITDALINLPNISEVRNMGSNGASVILNDGIKLELRIVENRYFGSLLQHSTGNQEHNMLLSDLAKNMNLSINEYGLTNLDTGEVENFEDEEGIYSRLGLQYIPPELRTGINELQPALDNMIPQLVQRSDILGDLHLHTDWSDGRDSINDMISAAKQRGLKYIAITDHSAGRGIANGLSPERLQKHKIQLRESAHQIGDIKVFSGTEMDIRADGSLDYSDDILKDLDWVIGSIHSAMGQNSHTMTERIIKAMLNPHVSVIGHLTTRIIGERKPIEADFESIFKAAADTGTALEINASLPRLDLKDAHIRKAIEFGVPLVINTDAHTFESLDDMNYGVAIARRGWCEPKHILNTLSLNNFTSYLRAQKSHRTRIFANHE